MEKPATRPPQSSTPTTFVQADTNTFRELVQRLTGASDTERHIPATIPAIPVAPPPSPSSDTTAEPLPALRVAGIRKPAFKLHERRPHYTRSTKLEIIKPGFNINRSSPKPVSSPLSPGFPASSLVLSSPQSSFPANSPTASNTPTSLSSLSISREQKTFSDLFNEEEEKAIAERRFYLHPSPQSRPGNAEPELLSLFPLTSPKTP